MFWRRRWQTKGFGMTLAKKDGGFDFNVSKFGPSAPCDTYHLHYGADGSGDITSTASFKKQLKVVANLLFFYTKKSRKPKIVP